VKILLFTIGFPPSIGGVQKYLGEIALRITAGQLFVYAARSSGSYIPDGVYPWRMRRYWTPDLSWLPNRIAMLLRISFFLCVLLRGVVRVRPSIIWSGSECWFLAIPSALIGKMFKIPTVCSVHGDLLPKDGGYGKWKGIRKWIWSFVLSNFDSIMVVSNYVRDLVLHLGVVADRIIIVPGGVDTRVFREGEGDYLRERLGLGACKVLLTVGRLDRRKNHEAVVRCLPYLTERTGPVKYVICGTGREEAHIRRVAREQGVEASVVFVQQVREDAVLQQYYASCDLFVMPNIQLEDGDTEGLGIVFLEAAACGKPVITGLAGGAPETVVHGVTGLSVDGRNLQGLRDAILSLLCNPQKAREMGAQGRERVIEMFSWDMSAKKVDEVLLQALRKKCLRSMYNVLRPPNPRKTS